MLYGAEHVRAYQETGGAQGYDWNGTHVLLLTTSGRKSGQQRTTPLIFGEHDGAYLVVASKGGAPEHPDWYKNLLQTPEVTVQVKDEVFTARARTAGEDERLELWPIMVREWPQYDEYQTKTERQIPVVVLERV